MGKEKHTYMELGGGVLQPKDTLYQHRKSEVLVK